MSNSVVFESLFFFSSRRRHTRWNCDWSSDVCSSDLIITALLGVATSIAVLRMVRLRRRLGAAHRRELERLRTAALRDGLTGLPNHRCFHEDLREAIADSHGRHLLLVDVDGLKDTNDGHGHKAGDELLVKLGTALDQVGAAHDAAAYRLGGDEFVLLVDAG